MQTTDGAIRYNTTCILSSWTPGSRNTSFMDDLLRETAGKGVDVPLNFLAEKLLHATWKCVAKWGTMVETGKRDLLGKAQLDMSSFLAHRNYCCLDVDQMRSERPELSSR